MRDDGLTDRVAVAVAVGSILAWLALVSIYLPHPIADEAGHHLRVIRQFYEGDWSLPAYLPMFPAYHAVAAVVCKVFGANLLVLRAFSAVMAIGAIWLFHATLRCRCADDRGDRLLHFAWLPILFPFTVLAYTESASMLLLVAALYLHTRRYNRSAAVTLLLACLVRQSNIVWAALFAVLTVRQLLRRRQGNSNAPAPGRKRLVLIVHHIWPHLIVVALIAALMLIVSGFDMGRVEANRPRFNIAQFYLFALFVILLWAPILFARLPGDTRLLRRWLTSNPAKGAMATTLGMATTLALVAAFRNPHPWNHNEAYFRNWALIAMSESWLVRTIASLLIVGAGASMVHFTTQQANRSTLRIVWLCSWLYLLPHSLAEPRYYIVPVFFLNFFTDYRPQEARRLTLWYLLIGAIIGAAILSKGGPEGGVW